MSAPMPPGQTPAAYSLYDLLRTLINRVGWPDQAEERLAIEAVNQAERMNIFGNLAQSMTCDHSAGVQRGKCVDCGKLINVGGTGSRW